MVYVPRTNHRQYQSYTAGERHKLRGVRAPRILQVSVSKHGMDNMFSSADAGSRSASMDSVNAMEWFNIGRTADVFFFFWEV